MENTNMCLKCMIEKSIVSNPCRHYRNFWSCERLKSVITPQCRLYEFLITFGGKWRNENEKVQYETMESFINRLPKMVGCYLIPEYQESGDLHFHGFVWQPSRYQRNYCLPIIKKLRKRFGVFQKAHTCLLSGEFRGHTFESRFAYCTKEQASTPFQPIIKRV